MSFTSSNTRTGSFPRRVLGVTTFNRRPRFPRPELSIGTRCCQLGNHQCWEVIGPAQEITESLFGPIKKLLESRDEYLNEGVCVPRALLFDMYMIGRTEQVATPTIMFSCDNKVQRQRALKLVRQSSLLDPYPCVALGDSSHPPRLSCQPLQLGEHGETENIPMGEGNQHKGNRGAVYSTKSVLSEYGFPVMVMVNNSHFRKATIGGFLCVGIEVLGLTVAHVLSEDFIDTAEKDAEAIEFSLDFDEEFETVGDGNMEFVNTTSRGSISPRSDMEDTLCSNDGFDDVAPQMPPSESSSAPRQGSLRLTGHQIDPNTTNMIGTILAVSSPSSSSNLDWALVRLESESVISNLKLSSKIARVKHFLPSVALRAAVLVRTAYNGVLTGYIGKTPTFMQSPPCVAFQEMWVVYLDGHLQVGDCGAWVVDANNMGLYGYIAAGDPGKSIAYIIPAYQAFADMEERLKSKIVFPSEVTYTDKESLHLSCEAEVMPTSTEAGDIPPCEKVEENPSDSNKVNRSPSLGMEIRGDNFAPSAGGDVSYGKTYRVQGIPATFTREDCRTLLSSALQSENESSEPVVHSLSADPYTTKFQIATVTFKQIPDRFQDGKDEWTIPVTKSNILGIISSLTVDCHFSGFTPLNSVRDASDHKIDCIAITGLGSHPFGSWKQRNGEHMWLRDGLPYDLEGARVLSYGYNSKLIQSQTFQSVEDIATAFLISMRSIRIHDRGGVTPRPLIFISHSLGGIILKKAILLMKDEDKICQEIFKSIYAVLFFGVPNQGFRVDHWLSMVKGQPNENLILSLGSNSVYLRDLHRDFRIAFDFQDSQIVCVYETERTRVAKQEALGKWKLTGDYEILVPKSLATDSPANDQGYRDFPIRQNHSDMAKFSSRWDENYKNIRTCLEEFSMAAPDVIRARFSRAQDKGPSQEPTDSAGWTRLHLAAFYGDEDRLKLLLRLSIDKETKDASGRTPLHIAAYHGKDAVSKILLDNNADQNARNYSGQTPLYSAASRGYESTAAILVDRGAHMEARDNERKTPLYTAARYGHEPTASLLVKKGANKETRANGDWTPLHAAAWFGHETIVRLLVDSSADMELKSQDGLTPLHCAVQNGHEAVMSLLIDSGADKMARTTTGQSLLHIAAHYGRDAVSRLLLDQGSDIEARDRDEKTPLYAAAKAGHEKVTMLLLDRKAKKNVKALGGWTPLHAAVWYDRESTSKALVEHGANIETKNEDGETPLFVAASHGHLEIVKLLVSGGANRKAKTNIGWTPSRVAEANGHWRVARFLRNFSS